MLLISDKHKFIFFHVPRTGGTSIEQILQPQSNFIYRNKVMYDFVSKNFGNKPFLKFYHSHTNAQVVKSAMKEQVFNHYFKFGVSRNPYDWFVSVYEYTKMAIINKTPHFSDLQDVVKKCNGFKDFVYWAGDNASSFQYQYFFDQNENKIVDKIIKFENLQNELMQLQSYFNFAIDIPHVNSSSKGKSYKKYYTPELTEIIYASLKKDFKLLEYDKDI